MKIPKLLYIVTALTTTAYAWGAPSRMRPVKVTAPDGTTVEITAIGDEHSHRFVDMNGADVDWLPRVNRAKATPAMKMRAQSPARATSFPTKGELPFLVILVEFNDKGFAFDDPAEEFDALLNQNGYDRYNGKGSVADFFRDNSAGAFSPRFEVAGPVKLSRGYSYYGGGSDDSAAGLMVIEACRLLDQEIDFSRYDLDNDGSVDNIYFYYAGKGEADGGDPGTIWPHSWNLSDQGRELSLDGVKIDAYACSPELDGADKPNGIGTFCHEFSHVLGLPDLYASSYSNALHPATWSLMASGNYNDDGRTPPGLSSYERYELGWLQPKELDYPLTVRMEPLVTSNYACRISTERVNEYFLLENRQQQGWDRSLPGHGMLVWHIDYNPNIWDRNVVNNNASHQYVDIVEANNATSHSQDGGFTFPGTAGVTSFTSTTTPALASWSGAPIDRPITSIKESAGDVVSFDVCGGKTPVGPVSGLEVTDIAMESCILRWDPAEMADEYVVRIDDAEGNMLREFTCTASPAEVTGLWPGETYLAQVYGQDRYERGLPAQVEIAMPAPTFEYKRVELHEPTDITATSYTQEWKALDGASAYEVTVARMEAVDQEDRSCGFDNRELPDGWSSMSTAWSSVAGYFGESAPSLRMTADGAMLATPFFPKEVTGVSFFMRGGSVSEGNSLIVEGEQAGSSRPVVVAELPVSSTGETVAIDNMPPGLTRLIFRFNRQGNTVVSIDDIIVNTGDFEEIPLEGWDPKEVGAEHTSVTVTGLAPATLYCCRVTAIGGAARSLPSKTIRVTTISTSGITLNHTDHPLRQEITAIYTIDGRHAGNSLSSLSPGLYIVITPSGPRKLHLPL